VIWAAMMAASSSVAPAFPNNAWANLSNSPGGFGQWCHAIALRPTPWPERSCSDGPASAGHEGGARIRRRSNADQRPTPARPILRRSLLKAPPPSLLPLDMSRRPYDHAPLWVGSRCRAVGDARWSLPRTRSVFRHLIRSFKELWSLEPVLATVRLPW